MKKNLLLIAACAVALSASAAVENGIVSAEWSANNDLGSKPTVADNFAISETANASMCLLYGQEVSAQNPGFNGFNNLVVNGEDFYMTQGIGGSANGVCNLNDGPSAGGCIYNLKVKADGWMIVSSKISSNKNFYVYEGMVGEDPLPVAYTMGMDIQNASYPDLHEIIFTLPADESGYVNLNAPDIDDYTFGGNAIAWPIRIGTKDVEAASAGNGYGVIAFPVYADAVNYLVFATGSKMNTNGYVFVPCDPTTTTPNVGFYCNEAVDAETGAVTREARNITVMGEPFAGVNNVVVDAAAYNENAPVYNVYGQRVSKDTKGLLIQNGVKFYNR